MEHLDINDIFDEEINVINHTMLPKNFTGDVRTTRAVQEQVAKLVDRLGQESTAAQGLTKVITSAEKMRKNPGHVLYLLKDQYANDGKGEIIGMLKVGRKHLFLFDEKQAVHEVEPLCVLDFYVVRDRQRMGYGRRIYDYMLSELEVMAWEMAIDGPSEKMEKFLARNFGINNLMRQSNNFAVCKSFFERSDSDISHTGSLVPVAPAAAVGRFAAPKPASAIANVIHGADQHEPSRRSATPAGAAPASAAPASAEPASAEPRDPWDDDWEEPAEPSDDDVYEFDPDQPPAERRDEIRARGPLRRSPVLERPATLAVQPAPAEHLPSAGVPSAGVPSAGMPSAGSAAGTPGARRDSQLTERGYFDVKYYHNKLW